MLSLRMKFIAWMSVLWLCWAGLCVVFSWDNPNLGWSGKKLLLVALLPLFWTAVATIGVLILRVFYPTKKLIKGAIRFQARYSKFVDFSQPMGARLGSAAYGFVAFWSVVLLVGSVSWLFINL